MQQRGGMVHVQKGDVASPAGWLGSWRSLHLSLRAEAVQLVRLVACAAAVLLLLAAPPASTQAWAQTSSSWPTRPIKLIVPTGPGAATDVMARLLAEGVTRGLGQPLVVENLAGASGLVAHQAAARAEADGYTLLFTNTSGMAINSVSFKQLPYDPAKDFTAVAMVCTLAPQMLSVNAQVPVHSVPELLAYARGQRGKLTIAFDATAGAAAFGARLLNRRADLGLIEVPYRSAAQMTQDVASGINQVMMSSPAAANAVVEAGKVRRLAVTSQARFPYLPDLPALTEHVPGVVMNGFFAVVAPAGTPPAIVARLNEQVGAYLKLPELQQRLVGFGLATEGAGTPQTTAERIRREQEQWRSLARELDIQPQ
jgi:tripartite-type tricarboxylate transporter receptor subunit TctC